jgi:hypothetical protein
MTNDGSCVRIIVRGMQLLRISGDTLRIVLLEAAAGQEQLGETMVSSYKYAVLRAGLVALCLALPAAALAAGAPASGPSLTLKAEQGSFAGKWVYRSFSNSVDPKANLAKVALGLTEMDLTEKAGVLTGTRTGQAKGTTYDLSGTARYAAKQGATIRLHGTVSASGKTWNYDYFGYLIPAWSIGGGQPDTILGTVLRTNPDKPDDAPLVASFTAVRESAK